MKLRKFWSIGGGAPLDPPLQIVAIGINSLTNDRELKLFEFCMTSSDSKFEKIRKHWRFPQMEEKFSEFRESDNSLKPELGSIQRSCLLRVFLIVP